MTILWILVIIAIIIGSALIAKWWIKTYNGFQYWFTMSERNFANIKIFMQERLDNIYTLIELVQQYNSHEYLSLRDTIRARNTFTSNSGINDEIKATFDIDKIYTKLLATLEKYPDLKSHTLHNFLMSRDSEIERALRHIRYDYNYCAQKYNEKMRQFPNNFIASIHNFYNLRYLAFDKQEKYEPRAIFSAN